MDVDNGDLFRIENTSWNVFKLSPLYKFSDVSFTDHALRIEKLLNLQKQGTTLEDRFVKSRSGSQTTAEARLLPRAASVSLHRVKIEHVDDVEYGIWFRFAIGADENEKIYSAILMCASPGTIASKFETSAMKTSLLETFDYFPVLLTRLPSTVQKPLLNYLSDNYDTRISPLKVTPAKLGSLVKNYLDSSPLKLSSSIELSFSMPSNENITGLSNFTISLPPGFIEKVRKDSNIDFMAAVRSHLNRILTLKLADEAADIRSDQHMPQLVSIACNGIVANSAGRVKFFPQNGKLVALYFEDLFKI